MKFRYNFWRKSWFLLTSLFSAFSLFRAISLYQAITLNVEKQFQEINEFITQSFLNTNLRQFGPVDGDRYQTSRQTNKRNVNIYLLIYTKISSIRLRRTSSGTFLAFSQKYLSWQNLSMRVTKMLSVSINHKYDNMQLFMKYCSCKRGFLYWHRNFSLFSYSCTTFYILHCTTFYIVHCTTFYIACILHHILHCMYIAPHFT